MAKKVDCQKEADFAVNASACDASELSGPLGNLARLLFSEAWRAKAQSATSSNAFINVTNLSRDFMRRNVAMNTNIPQIAISQ